MYLREELIRFVRYLVDSGRLGAGAGTPDGSDIVEGYLRSYQEAARPPVP